MPLDAIVVNKNDNVATAVRPLDSGQSVHIDTAAGAVDIVLLKAIPFGHKFALRDIRRDERIIKYGEEVGQANEESAEKTARKTAKEAAAAA